MPKKILLLTSSVTISLFCLASIVSASTNGCVAIASNISYGNKGIGVVQLQQFLISQNLLSSDSATGFFGRLTEAAVQSWQKSHGVVSSGSPATTGYGSVGPKTRLALAHCTSTSSSITISTQPSVSSSGGVAGSSSISQSGTATNQGVPISTLPGLTPISTPATTSILTPNPIPSNPVPTIVIPTGPTLAFYVSQNAGSDSYDGSLSKPFKSVEDALARVRTSHLANANYNIHILDPQYVMNNGITIDNSILLPSSSLSLQGASNGTMFTFAQPISQSSLAVDDSYLGKVSNGAYDFGGMYSFLNSNSQPNLATGASTCPQGFTATLISGQTGKDFPATLCYRKSQDAGAVYDFGGMFGYVDGKPYINAITGDRTCPAGYTIQYFTGTENVDWPAVYCYRAHIAGRSPDYDFGGMYGFVNGIQSVNPITGDASCPPGFINTLALGTQGTDWPLYYCYRPYQAAPSIAGHVYIIPVSSQPGGLLINGKLAPRASYTATQSTQESDGTFTIPNAPVVNAGAHLIATGRNQWRAFRCSVVSYRQNSTANNALNITLSPSCLADANFISYGFTKVYSIENDPAFFVHNGDWAYVNDANRGTSAIALYLTQPSSISVIPSGTSQVFTIAGTADTPVQNISLNNIHVSGAGYMDDTYYASFQTGIAIKNGNYPTQDAAVKIENAKNISIANTTFEHLLGAGVYLGAGVKQFSITNSVFNDLAGMGIQGGTSNHPTNEQGTISNVSIKNNTFTNFGKTYWDSTAIFVSYLQNSEIANNTIDNGPYSGIAIGWGWTYNTQTGLGSNTIHDNKISNVMQMLNDGAGIYLNSRMNGSSVYGNTIGSIGAGDTSVARINFPLYADDGAAGINVHDNIITQFDFSLVPLTPSGNKYITPSAPIFGPEYVQGSVGNNISSCGFKACEIQQSNNIVR